MLSVMAQALLARVAGKVGTFVAKYRRDGIHNFDNYFGSTLDAKLDELTHPVLGIRGKTKAVCEFSGPCSALQVSRWAGWLWVRTL